MILGLDLSSVNTGYSIMGLRPDKGGDLITSIEKIEGQVTGELLSYGNIIPQKNFNHGAKLEFFYTYIKEIIKKHDIKIVVIEDQHLRSNVSTLKLLTRISGVAMLAAQQANCIIEFYPAPTVKKEFTGNGRAKKKDMVAKAKEKYDINDDIDDNIADAIGVAYTYIEKELQRRDANGN